VKTKQTKGNKKKRKYQEKARGGEIS